MNWFLKCINQYSDFSGRARRTEYWMFMLFNMIFACIAIVLDNALGLADPAMGYGVLYGIYALVMLIPGLAVCARRLHDVGKSGWFMFISLIPIIGGIWLLVLICTDGHAEENKWGKNPKI